MLILCLLTIANKFWQQYNILSDFYHIFTETAIFALHDKILASPLNKSPVNGNVTGALVIKLCIFFKLADGANLDAFRRLSVSSSKVLFDMI